jgi:eukaryotic-like serine/threonine-protein kinase
VHGAGLVHRDVKTRNVVREDSGRIVLMDFGAGLDLRNGTDESGGITGTPIYLAPEVLRGEPASPRSDLFSLGVLLYRLVTRGYPFAGDTLDALRESHARGDMRPLGGARPGLPAAFRRVVERALAPDPAARFAGAAEMEAALVAALDAPRRAARRRAIIAAGVAAVAVTALGIALAGRHPRTVAPGTFRDRPQVAVADITDDAHDPGLDVLPGMLAIALEQSRGLMVLTHSQMSDLLAGAGQQADARIDQSLGLEVCRGQRATALLVPSVRRAGNDYRMTLAALEPEHGRRLFTISAVARGRDGLAMAVDSLAQRVRGRLERGPESSRAALLPVAQITTPRLDAYERYDRGERLIDRLAMTEARAELERAVALDSSFALAHARLAYVCWWLNDDAEERAQLAAAFQLIDRVPDRYRFKLRAQGAMAERQGLEVARSILLDMERFYPNDKEMLYDIGDYSSHLNEFPQAIQYLERVIAVDPHFARALQHLARVYRDMGRSDRFLQLAKRYAAADSVWDAYVLLGNALVASGDVETGIAMLARGRAVAPDHGTDYTMFIARARLFEGRCAEGRRELDERLRTASGPIQRAGALHERALGSIHCGACAAALADLDRAVTLARQGRDIPTEARSRMEAAGLLMLAWNDRAAAFRRIAGFERAESAITYRDAYFDYWPWWGGLFKLHLLDGNLGAAEALARRKFVADKWYGPYVEAYLDAARGNCAQAAADASRILEWGPADENISLLYFLARCQLEHGLAGEAVASLRGLQSLYSHLTLGTPLYAKSLVLLGEAYERSGDPESAAASNARLLDPRRAGDPPLPDCLEARRRLDRLKPRLAAAKPGP